MRRLAVKVVVGGTLALGMVLGTWFPHPAIAQDSPFVVEPVEGPAGDPTPTATEPPDGLPQPTSVVPEPPSPQPSTPPETTEQKLARLLKDRPTPDPSGCC